MGREGAKTMIWVSVDKDSYAQKDYLGRKEKSDEQYFRFFDLWRELLPQNSPDARTSVSKLRRIVDAHGADAADGAVNILLGSETATDLISSYENMQEWEDDPYWYEVKIESNINYMADNYGPADCRDELEGGMLPQVWTAEREYPQVKEAIDAFCREFFGMDFAELFSMA